MIVENQNQGTEAVLAELERIENPRTREIVTAAVRHLHDFAREVKLTEDEFRQACAFIARLGQHTNDTHNEVVLLRVSLALPTLFFLLNNGKKGQTHTTANLRGPFFLLNSPATKNGDS